jgi:alpha-glucosidase (family GH31 glycosyl hydrolase)
VLTLGILGYPFVIPDVIGGNGFMGDNLTSTKLPERELYIRWLQLATYLPVMKFSIPPWDYDDQMIEITKDLLKKRESVLPKLLIYLISISCGDTTQPPNPHIPIPWGTPPKPPRVYFESLITGKSI